MYLIRYFQGVTDCESDYQNLFWGQTRPQRFLRTSYHYLSKWQYLLEREQLLLFNNIRLACVLEQYIHEIEISPSPFLTPTVVAMVGNLTPRGLLVISDLITK